VFAAGESLQFSSAGACRSSHSAAVASLRRVCCSEWGIDNQTDDTDYSGRLLETVEIDSMSAEAPMPWTGLVAALALALMCGGCISTEPRTWSHAPDESTRAKRDIYECQADADAVSYRATAFGGAIMPIVGLFQRRSTFNDCMAARGWRPAQ
jgi:hypothetical protein